MYTVGQMARMIDVAPSTLRYYDKEGLLPFVERSGGGIRLFREIDFEWLKIINCLKRTGMPLRDIKDFIDLAMQGDETIAQRQELFVKQRAEVERQLEQLREMDKLLEYKCWFYEQAKLLGSTKAVKQLPDEQIPERFRCVKESLCSR